MTADRNLDQLLRSHFQDRADGTVLDGQLDAVLHEAASIRQRPGWLAALRSPSMTTIAIPQRASIPRSAWLLAALALLVALAMVAAFVGSHRPPQLPVNGRIVFGRFDPALDGTVIYAVNPDGSHLVKLRPETHEGAAWSPDGRQIGMIDAVMNADGTGYRARDFSQGPLTLWAWDWSPDGKRLLMEGGSDADASAHGVYTVRANGGGDLVRLSKPGDEGLPAAYSPDGSTVMWYRPIPGQQASSIMLVATDGTHERQLGTLTVTGGLSWAPDGRSVLASSSGRLYSVDVATGTATQVMIQSDPEARIPGAQWSPDGTRILIRRRIDTTHWALFTMRPDGTDLVQVTDGLHDDQSIDWGIHPLK